MAEFKPIETQEELNRVIGATRREATERAKEQFADYDELKAAKADLEARLAKAEEAAKSAATDKDGVVQQVKGLEEQLEAMKVKEVKTRAAIQMGLPYDLADRLKGTTEEDILKDAETLSLQFKPKAQPLADSEPSVSKNDSKEASMKAMLHSVLGGTE